MCSFFYATIINGERYGGALNGYYVIRLWTFLAVGYAEFYFLAFGQSFESVTLDSTEMDKNVRAIFALDKAEALALVKPFNCAGDSRHMYYLYYLLAPHGGRVVQDYLWFTNEERDVLRART
jgi:hypothetical protein